MQRKKQIKVDSLSRFMVYILGHRPDEFGLVPDEAGFVTYKELLWAMHEEPGWSYVSQSHINEVLIGKDRALFETDGPRIRASDRRWRLDLENPAPFLPKILFVAVRRKAHPRVMEHGLRSERYLALSSDREMAMRMGRRKDQMPVVLETMTGPAQEQGISFYPFGDLFLAREIPAGFISGPPVSKEILAGKETEKAKAKKPEEKPFEPLAGTFVLDMARDPDLRRRAKGKKDRGWKEQARSLRRRKGL